MTASYTNRGLILMVTGEEVGLWGGKLNTTDITLTDQILGSTLPLTISTGTTAITQAQSANLAFALTGTLSGNVTLTLPLNINSATVAMGGNFVFSNATTGNFTVTVKTVAVGSTGVTVPRGLRAILYSNGTNVYYANDGGKAIGSSVIGYDGNPDGVVACTPATAFTPADMLWDYTNDVLYVCTGSPNTWSQAIPTAVTSIPTPASGYLTLSSSATNPILTNDATGATTIYYTPFSGDVIGIPNGSTFSTYQFSQLTLSLSATYQAASGIYDVFGFVDSGNAVIGFGPIWTTGGGSVTAGSCARGTGAASTQLSRLLGSYVNTVSMTLNNGATTYSISPQCGIYLGTVLIDSTAGQMSCHRSYGQARKWGVWNAYNRVPLYLKGGDSTASWTIGGTYPTFQPSNNDANNKVTVLSGLAEEIYDFRFKQTLGGNVVINSSSSAFLGVGFNSTSASSGIQAEHRMSSSNLSGVSLVSTQEAEFVTAPSLGINVITCLESASEGNVFANGTETNMLLAATWRG